MPAANAVPRPEATGLRLPDAADRAPAFSRALAPRLALAPPRQICETRIRGRSRGAEAAGASDRQLHWTGDAQHLGRSQTLSREGHLVMLRQQPRLKYLFSGRSCV